MTIFLETGIVSSEQKIDGLLKLAEQGAAIYLLYSLVLATVVGFIFWVVIKNLLKGWRK